jgi:extracellular matrix protein 14
MLLRYLLLLVNLSVQYGVTDALLVQPQSNLRPSLDTVTPQSNNNLRKWKQRFLSASRFFGIGNSRNTSPVRHKKQIAAKNLAPYVNDVVLRFNISGHHDSEIRALSDATDRLYLDVWSYTNDHMDIRLTRGTIPLLLDLLPKSLQDSHTPLMHSLIEQALDTYPNSPESTLPHVPEPASQPKADILFFQDYQPLSVITPWMKLLQSMFPSFVEVVTIGKSYEGRDIHGLKVGMKTDPDVNKKTIIMTGAAHAREWISVSTISYLAYSMVTRYKKEDRGIDNMVDKFDWIFIPTLNVDGYVYTWKEDRLWRKNRQPTKLAFCKGIDLDRAYDFHFDNTPESSSNPCSDMFPGGYPFQAQEARVFAEWVSNYTADGNQILGLIDFHSYSQQSIPHPRTTIL